MGKINKTLNALSAMALVILITIVLYRFAILDKEPSNFMLFTIITIMFSLKYNWNDKKN